MAVGHDTDAGRTPGGEFTAGGRFRGRPPGAPANLAVRYGLGSTPFAAHLIPPTTRCCYEARRFTDRTLARWGMQQVRDDAVQVVSELVANAARHGQRRRSDPDGTKPAVWLALAPRPRTLLCVVSDPGPRRPRLFPPSPLAERHRGLPIVEALSEDWGWSVDCGSRGKSVWARLPLPRD
ncbi:ATP-binding protein [Streptomyces uncialis]|uniref:ATP-binding protein n=1 Tax=Streptomyces uncialis TaxID=1048205 RepID=UPI00093B883F|nr:ATP-binding protein [Streptomyces uncialis]WTE14543.1 ATP-binding protein [Streptomyces uncialis]